MGASSSTQTASSEEREVEALAASTGALPMLRKSFSNCSDPDSNSIPPTFVQRCFSIHCKKPIHGPPTMPEQFPELLDNLGSSIGDIFFVSEKGGLSWVEYVRGYVKCCGRMTASMMLTNLLRVFAYTAKKTGFPLNLSFEDVEGDFKASGYLKPIDVLLLLWMCWSMLWSAKCGKISREKVDLYLPNVRNLVLSAVISCGEDCGSLDVWNCDVFGLEVLLPVGKFISWVMGTVPALPDCFSKFVHENLQSSVVAKDEVEPSSSSSKNTASAPVKGPDAPILSPGHAWAISLTQRSTLSEEILRHCFITLGDETSGNLLYRSSLHGKGLNRFWSNVEGYIGPLLILISGTSGDLGNKKWIIGALTQQGFENKDQFYGSSGNLYAIDPIFSTFLPSGKDKNFIYSHLHPTGRVYDPRPKPVGIALGGTVGNERVFIDEDFSRITVRHHAVDKTYQPGSLLPNQGFLPVEASISEVEVWGLGGSTAKEVQSSFQMREQLFTEQRRKVDMKKFANWEDSPEKMMMDMMSDPNRVQREDR